MPCCFLECASLLVQCLRNIKWVVVRGEGAVRSGSKDKFRVFMFPGLCSMFFGRLPVRYELLQHFDIRVCLSLVEEYRSVPLLQYNLE